MFVTPELHLFEKLIKNHAFSASFLHILQQQYTDIEATLLYAKALRQVTPPQLYYIVQNSISILKQQAYVFAPLILANLNKTVIYHGTKTAEVSNVLQQYYAVEQSDDLAIQTCLEALNVYFHLEDPKWNKTDFFYFSLIQALCRADVAHIFLITELALCQQTMNALADFFAVKISWVNTTETIFIPTEKSVKHDPALDLTQLLFKHKNPEYIQRCEHFSKLNALLLMQCDVYSQDQSQHLIEDMFYAEHLHERLSVYAEYMQTCSSF